MSTKCIFCDIDGTLIKYREFSNYKSSKAEPINSTVKEINRAFNKGHNIILTTGRKEGMRKSTEDQLRRAGIIYDMLIMGIGGGSRVLINDLKPDRPGETAIAINLIRDSGVSHLDI